ncbi:D-alanyl-D-alanine carboxypeptidase family protein [Actinomarinicola tropica]|uniref:SLH domain-containing protein n=1 Tax=Actinomarinicola tropica TaxID=2789776 RepID=A0A5Q2RJ33_9ACTN|nr:D-alanyl-D-alanine carboxypeptidase family protein [Actinomarinicola tropica]QGG96868.1 hypothetical protein GH723_18170 [Actinomarinicola tropica]
MPRTIVAFVGALTVLAASLVVAPPPPAAADVADFVDVRGHEYYAPAVAWMRSSGITTGVSPHRYHPIGAVTRGQMITFTWRMAGAPTGHAAHEFVDTIPNAFYERALQWARAEGHTTGVGGSNRFEPDRPVTRAELVTFLWRLDGSPSGHPAHGFVDTTPNAFYERAVRWARAEGHTTGVGGSNRFEPDGTSTRGQAATFIWRYEGSPPPPNPGGARDCGSFRSQVEAQAWFDLYRRYYGDVAGLDPDRDGVVCRELPPPPAFPTLTPEEFRQLHLAIEPLPGTRQLTTWPHITGHAGADQRIQTLAQQRGYRLRAVPTVGLVSVHGVLLVPEAAHGFAGLVADARAQGLPIAASSGYRSVDHQRQIFRRQMGNHSAAAIANGSADGAILSALRYHSIPGTSKHHLGRTVDLNAGSSLGAFEGSRTEVWLRSNNFHNAKRHGFIPSYPRGVAHQGPDPEPWEYVHLGAAPIQCAAFYIEVADPMAPAACPMPPA